MIYRDSASLDITGDEFRDHFWELWKKKNNHIKTVRVKTKLLPSFFSGQTYRIWKSKERNYTWQKQNFTETNSLYEVTWKKCPVTGCVFFVILPYYQCFFHWVLFFSWSSFRSTVQPDFWNYESKVSITLIGKDEIKKETNKMLPGLKSNPCWKSHCCCCC